MADVIAAGIAGAKHGHVLIACSREVFLHCFVSAIRIANQDLEALINHVLNAPLDGLGEAPEAA
jgi:hypothetical protein